MGSFGHRLVLTSTIDTHIHQMEIISSRFRTHLRFLRSYFRVLIVHQRRVLVPVRRKVSKNRIVEKHWFEMCQTKSRNHSRPPSNGFREPDCHCDLDFVQFEYTSREYRVLAHCYGLWSVSSGNSCVHGECSN